MRHCSKSRPLRDLLKDLSEFDFEGYLNMPFGPYQSTLSRTDPFYTLPSFFHWIYTQVHFLAFGISYSYQRHGQTCQSDKYNLGRKYTAQFDRFLKSRLSQYPADPISRLLFTSSTLDPFHKHCPIIIRLLTIQEPHIVFAQYMSHDVAGCAFMYADDPKTSGYYRMVAEFLTNEDRAGIYYIDKTRYKHLAKFFVNILSGRL